MFFQLKMQVVRRAVCLVGACLWCAASRPAAAGIAAAPPPPALPLFEVSSGTPLLAQAASTGAVVGQGGNFAVALPDGRMLWLLNGVMTGERRPDGQAEVWDIVDGAAAFSASTSPYAQRGGLRYVSDENRLPVPLLSSDLKEYTQVRKFWPRSGRCAGGKCCVFYSIMNNYGPGLYDYFRVGQGVAWSDAPGGPYRKALYGASYSFWNDIEPAFGSALLEDADGWLYVYGRQMTAPGEYAAALARVRPDQLLSRDKYLYYGVEASSGPWTGDISEASPVMSGLPEDFSVSYNEYLKTYLAVYLDEESGSVLARQARYPWGPWADPVKLMTCGKEDYCFGAREQPAFAADGGRRVFLTVEKKNEPWFYEVTFK
jgi:hypothetical protein